MALRLSQHDPWITLTDLGRMFGISAVQCGRVLSDASLRDHDGLPTKEAVDQGYAYRRPEQNANRSTLWHQSHCEQLLRQNGLEPVDETRLVEQWVELLEALDEGSPSILADPQDMAAEEMPMELVGRVNQRLQDRGSGLRIAWLPPASGASHALA
ncbi:MAG: hypothetical protein ERJ67_00705 [Aphanocapsa feldmannii 277cV]|uniref:Uncharacterized protein n=2 Tax=Aphanocapsa feldmannii TaxID=192050 RepID=A0A524RR44_9CHRO|nr:MAG: hypothetical protein ERJ69_01855 [Aphanocapsa feldmannii 288cV]TGG96640.1 MAG: hypothetical protein ERJ67_00705 [Aphanocapsa feldmannii 277cV]TGH18654.1 MAG: hypothetical protein ERJ68_08905 [Aphanocapsa feldmannii 277cI]